MTYASAIEQRVNLFGGQLVALVIVAVSAIVVGLIERFAPSFFPYHYFFWSGWSAVARFWPIFAWGFGLNVVLGTLSRDNWPIHPNENRTLLGWGLVTSTLAGIWEELGYRWAFICFAMIGIAVFNFVFGAGLGWIAAVAFVVFAIISWIEKIYVLAALAIGAAVLSVFFALYGNPVYWLCQFIVWVAHLTTFGYMDSVLYGSYPTLMVFGALIANSWFHDGHRYQGIGGMINSWYAGMVLIYATFTYGLWTAMVIHILYDVIIDASTFVVQKTK